MSISDEDARAAEVITRHGLDPRSSRQAKWLALEYVLRVAKGQSVSLPEFRQEFWRMQGEAATAVSEAPPSSH